MEHDFRLAFRALRRSPVYAAVGIVSLALGIAANVTVFSIVNALLVRPLPVPDPDRLLRVGRSTRAADFGTVSFPEYRDLKRGAADVAELIAHFPQSAILTAGDEPRDAWLELVSANYFSALQVPLAAGRGFLPADDERLEQVVVLSNAVWQSRFNSDPAILGRVVRVNARPFTVIGVAPSSFRGTFAGFAIDAWVPARTQPITNPQGGSIEQRDDRSLMMMARLRPGVSMEQAQTRFDVLATRVQQAQAGREAVRIRSAPASGVHPFIAQIVRGFLALLQGIVGLVLVIACANLANILLVRTESRRRELAVRVALGASASRIARLVLAESLTIAVAGGALGLGISYWLNRALERIDLPAGIPVALTLGVDATVVVGAIAITLLTAVAFGVGPAFSASRANATADLRSTGVTADRRRARVRNVLVAAQVGVATVLLAGSSLLLRSLANTSRVDPGFDARGVTLFAAAPELLGYDEARGLALWSAITARVAPLPGVERASLALMVPLGNRGDQVAVGRVDAKDDAPARPYNFASPGYFETVRMTLLRGRDFRATDTKQSPDVVIVNEAMASELFPRISAVGQQVRVIGRDERDRLATIVGVVATTKIQTLGEAPRPMIYLPFGQWYRSDMILHVRTRTPDAALMRRVVDEIHAVEPSLAVNVQTMQQATTFSLIPLRVAGTVLGAAGFIGVVLAAIGVFGLVAYAVSLRTREIGVRMALGGTAGHVAQLVVRHGMRPIVAGLLAGLSVALAVGQLLRGLLVGIGPSDPVSLALVCVVLLGSAGVALIVPVRRAVSVDPARTLRSE
jgi:predicted permease